MVDWPGMVESSNSGVVGCMELSLLHGRMVESKILLNWAQMVILLNSRMVN